MSNDSAITVGFCQLYPTLRLLKGPASEAALSPLACRFIERLARQPGRAVSRADLIEDLWAGNYLVGEPALNRLVSETRRAARLAGAADLIETVQRAGYRLPPVLGLADSTHLPAREAKIRWAIYILAFIIFVVGAKILMDEAMGLAWVMRHGD